jgi:hypothetical protein
VARSLDAVESLSGCAEGQKMGIEGPLGASPKKKDNKKLSALTSRAGGIEDVPTWSKPNDNQASQASQMGQ